MRRLFAAALAAALPAASLAQAEEKTLFVPNNMSGTIATFRVKPDGALIPAGVFPCGTNPYDVAVTPDGKWLVVAQTSIEPSELVHVMRVNPDSTLTLQPNPTPIGDGNLSVSMTPTGLAAIPSTAGDYTRLFKVIDGQARQVSQIASGSFTVKTMPSPDGSLIFATDSLGLSFVRSFAIAPNGQATLAGSVAIAAGSVQGLAVHPSLPILYASTALGQTVERLVVSPSGGLSLGGSTHTGGDSVVEIAVHPNGQWLYAGHVRSDTVTVLPVDADGFVGAPVQTVSIGPDFRDVITDGTFVFVTDESSAGGSPTGVIRFRIEANGLLTRLDPFAPTAGIRPSMMALWDPALRIRPGDVNADRAVNLADFLLLASAYDHAHPSPMYIPSADFDGDGVVDLADYLVLAANYGS
jgi:DNA-binding beta-propeller fold protein YncE